jgi:L-ascorbate metabolism protein UlaG (beta-lactamase superfamily)
MAGLVDRLIWLGHAGVAVDFPPLVVIDPYQVPGSSRKAGIILVTHAHHDHLDPPSIAVLAGPETKCFCPADCLPKMPKGAKAMSPGDRVEIMGVEITAVPAYNINKRFHPKGSGGVGYIIRHADGTVYHAGDTDLIPEMADIRCDIALLPVSGTYVMTAEEAVKAVELIRPKVAVPIHYGSGVGDPGDGERFMRLCSPGVRVVIPTGSLS